MGSLLLLLFSLGVGGWRYGHSRGGIPGGIGIVGLLLFVLLLFWLLGGLKGLRLGS